MILTGYYNKKNKMVIITKKNVENPVVETFGNVTVMKKEDEVVALNIKTDREFTSHMVDVNEFADELKEYFGIEKAEAPFVYGEIVTCEAHPKSKKLQICQININEEENLQIVCGAANCAAGNIAIVARVGAVMPTGMYIGASKLIDVDSAGMLCSDYELGFSAEAKKGITLFAIGEKEIGSKIY